jgi:2-keto-4-pentenoate hydratase/2-oxohepta-3-ene-1,7-dioic acid hydratase in catechol pathway
MRFVRYTVGDDKPRYGWLFQDKVGPIEGEPFGDYRRMEASMPLERVGLLAPLQPGKIIAVGRNYVEHAKERGAEVPEIPLTFLKPPTTVIGPGESIILPPQSQRVDHEAELAVVIGKPGRWIQPEDSMAHVLGYTIANDVTARDLQQKDGQWTRGKGFDTFCPLGPWIDTEVDPTDLRLTCRVNSEMRQIGSTRDMVFSVQQLIAFISSVMTLLPGDVILTGTPAGIGPLNAGDVVEVEIEGIGTLRNPVALDRH